MIRQIVILGHSGFIGTHLQHHLRSTTSIEVLGLSSPEADITTPAGAARVGSALDQQSVLIVLAGVKPAVGNDLTTFRRNIDIAAGLVPLIESCAVARIVYFSSTAVYGEDREDTSITEATPVAPTSFYGIAKYASERLLQRSLRDPDDRLVILRPATVYGPGDASRQYGPAGFVDAALHGGTVTLWGDGTERREFVFVGDIVRIVGGLALEGRGGVVNIVTGESRSFAEILEAVAACVGRRPRVTSHPRTRPKVDHGFIPVGLRERLPDFAFTSLSDAISRTVG